MCSYQRLNGSYGCQNSKTLNGLLKNELGFQGYVVSDWLVVHAGVASIEAGLVSMAKVFNIVESTSSRFELRLTQIYRRI